VESVSGNLKGTSAQFFCLQRCPYPTVGRPIGSGPGLEANPSNCLMRSSVALLTIGEPQPGLPPPPPPPPPPGRQHLKSAGPGQRSVLNLRQKQVLFVYNV
jgi:hypothetical protein